MCIWIAHVCSHFLDVQESNRSSRMDGLPALQFWENVLATLRDRVIPSHAHSDACVFESIDHVPPNIPTLYIFERSCSDAHAQQRTKAKLLARHKNAQSRFGLVV